MAQQLIAFISVFLLVLLVCICGITRQKEIEAKKTKSEDVTSESMSAENIPDTSTQENFICIYHEIPTTDKSHFTQAIFLDEKTGTLYGYLGEYANYAGSAIPGGLFELVTPYDTPFVYDDENIPKLKIIQSSYDDISMCVFIDSVYKVRYAMVSNGFNSGGVTVLHNADGSISTYSDDSN